MNLEDKKILTEKSIYENWKTLMDDKINFIEQIYAKDSKIEEEEINWNLPRKKQQLNESSIIQPSKKQKQ